MVEAALSIASVPSGHGHELVAVALYDEPESHAFQTALKILNVSHHDVTTDEGSFRARRVLFHSQLVDALENFANGRAAFFDVITVTRGRWAGLQAVGVGSTSRKRKRAAKIALAIAAVGDARSVMDTVTMRNIRHFEHAIQRAWVPWKPEIHRHWDLLSRRTVKLLLLWQQRQSHEGLAAIQAVLISQVLPFMMPSRFEIW